MLGVGRYDWGRIGIANDTLEPQTSITRSGNGGLQHLDHYLAMFTGRVTTYHITQASIVKIEMKQQLEMKGHDICPET
jgi:hypothetical protein